MSIEKGEKIQLWIHLENYDTVSTSTIEFLTTTIILLRCALAACLCRRATHEFSPAFKGRIVCQQKGRRRVSDD